MSEIENLKIGNGGTLHIVGNEDIIANEWEAGQVYIENRSYVIREHKLLMCNTTHTSVEPFDPDKWTEKNIGEALGTAGSANMIECTLAEYTAWKAGGQLINETVYVITDAPNLNATAKEISYDGSTDTVWDKVEGKQAQIIYNLVAYDDFTSSTTFSYIGKSITAPTGHCYIVKARLSYINNAPQEMGASRSNSNADVYQCFARTDKSAEITFILASGETAYFWAKHNGVGSNKILIAVVDITL